MTFNGSGDGSGDGENDKFVVVDEVVVESPMDASDADMSVASSPVDGITPYRNGVDAGID